VGGPLLEEIYGVFLAVCGSSTHEIHGHEHSNDTPKAERCYLHIISDYHIEENKYYSVIISSLPSISAFPPTDYWKKAMGLPIAEGLFDVDRRPLCNRWVTHDGTTPSPGT
jgi:hypothetical protein